MGRFKLNVSGTLFEFDSHILPNGSKLLQICEQNLSVDKDIPLFVGRPAKNFSAILAFYQTGELHIPLDVCPGSFQDELDYWNMDQSLLTDCCLYRLNSFLEENETRREFTKETNSLEIQHEKPKLHDMKYFRWLIWSILDYQESTLWAKIYFIVMSLAIILSILSLAASTLSSMRRQMTKCEVLEYLHHSDHEYAESIQRQYDHLDCNLHHFSTDNNDYMHDIFGNGETFYDEESGRNITVLLDDMTVPITAFVYLDLLLLIMFTIDILLRLVTCPSILHYFLSVVNIVDALAILSSYVYITILQIEREHRYMHSWIHALNFFQVFRSLRFLRVLRKIRASQVLAYSFRKNSKDMAVLFLFLFFSVSTFGSILYFTENREVIQSIPRAWYLAIITLTTVGYGDVIPETTPGLVVASACAVTGIILLAISVPIFVNSFLTLYQYSVIDDFSEHRQVLNRQFNGEIVDTNARNIEEEE